MWRKQLHSDEVRLELRRRYLMHIESQIAGGTQSDEVSVPSQYTKVATHTGLIDCLEELYADLD